jgi:hypothetical protein
MEKITFGDGLPGYIAGPADAPALIVLQVPQGCPGLGRPGRHPAQRAAFHPQRTCYCLIRLLPCPPPLSPPQEWWGVNDTIKAHAQAFADAGFRCLVPDLYKGKLGIEVEEAHHVGGSPQLAHCWPPTPAHPCAADG